VPGIGALHCGVYTLIFHIAAVNLPEHHSTCVKTISEALPASSSVGDPTFQLLIAKTIGIVEAGMGDDALRRSCFSKLD